MPLAGQPTRTQIKQAARAKARAASDRQHERYVVKTYGLEPGEYAARLEAQDGRCAICGRKAVTRRLAVDHDHNTGRPRSLLCNWCNKALGLWEFEPFRLHLLIAYASDILDSFEEMPGALVEPRSPVDAPVRLLT